MAWVCRKQFIVAVYDVVFPPAQKRGMVKFPGKGHFILEVEHHVTGHNNTSAIFDWG